MSDTRKTCTYLMVLLFELKSVGLFISFPDYSISRSRIVEFCADLHKIYNYTVSNCRTGWACISSFMCQVKEEKLH